MGETLINYAGENDFVEGEDTVETVECDVTPSVERGTEGFDVWDWRDEAPEDTGDDEREHGDRGI